MLRNAGNRPNNTLAPIDSAAANRRTVASRLRKARAEFHAIIKRKRAKGEIPGGDR